MAGSRFLNKQNCEVCASLIKQKMKKILNMIIKRKICY